MRQIYSKSNLRYAKRLCGDFFFFFYKKNTLTIFYGGSGAIFAEKTVGNIHNNTWFEKNKYAFLV
jgi:hypothetical protein